MPRRIRDALGSVLTLIAIVAVLMLVDQRVRGRVGGLATEIADDGWRAPSQAVNTVVATGWHQYSDNTYLVAFLAVGAVLVCLMLRT